MNRRGGASALVGAAAVALVAVGCGGGQTRANLFGAEWSDDGGSSIEAVHRRLAGVRPSPGADVVVGIAAGTPERLIGQPLGGGAAWTFAHALDARPVVSGTVVVGSGAGEVFGLDAKTGARLWARPTGGLPLKGAGDDGAVTVVSLGAAQGRGSTLLAVARDGHVVRQVETDRELGTPAVLGGMAFVPWGNQYVSVLDLSRGDEAGRILLREKVSRAWTVGGALHFGEVGIFRFDERIKDAARGGASHVAVPARELPGSPKLMVSGTERLPVTSGAQERIRVFARPTAAGTPLALDSDRLYATYFRLVFGLTGKQGDLAWVHTHPVDVLGGAAGGGTFVSCDASGMVTILDAHTGGVMAEQPLGASLRSCVVQIDAFRPAASPPSPRPLAAQITEALASGDAQLHTGQKLLLRELATLADEQATRTLVDLASDPRTSPEIVVDARAALAARRNGASAMLSALERHFDFLRDVLRAPPVGPIAQALGAMKERRAAPLLASHLLDPQSTEDDCKHAAAALVALASVEEIPSLRQYLALYRANAVTDDLAASVVSVGQALLKVGGAPGRALVDGAARDPATSPLVASRLSSLLEAQ